MAEKKGKPTYAGSIKNSGSQVVEPLFDVKGGKGKNVVKTGDDLRNGK